jgi:hypothetical protein
MHRNKKLLLVTILSMVFAILLMGATTKNNALYATVGPRYVTVGAADCTPRDSDFNYHNFGRSLRGETGAGTVYFACAVNFPDYGTHVITAITLYAYDQHTWQDQDVIARAYRVNPATGTESHMGTARSTGSSATDPRSFTISWGQINPKHVYPGHKMYFWLSMLGHDNLKMYGIKVRYNLKN